MFCAYNFHGNSVNNMLSYCGLIDAKIRASDKDLPVSSALLFLLGIKLLYFSSFLVSTGSFGSASKHST